MTIRHLKIFITVAECGKMRKAAELLFISQPSVSQAIGELEKYYGVRLFDRLSQRIYLTTDGELLLSYARHVVDSFENMDVVMKNHGLIDKIRLGGSVSVGTYLFDSIISEVNKENNNIKIKVVINNTACIEDMLLKSQLDIGVIEGVVQSKELIKIPILSDELVIIVGKDYPLYTKNSINLDQLAGHFLISREDGSVDRNQYERLLNENNIELEQIWSCSNTEAIKNAVASGRGIAIISRMLIKKELQENKFKVLHVNGVNVNRDIQVVYHKDKYISDGLRTLIDICEKVDK